MKAIVIANGELAAGNWWQKWTQGADIIIAADGGTRHALSIGLTPDIIIGDLDSLDAELVKQLEADGVQMLRHSPHKDETDTELALLHALRLGATEIGILGALGGRLDHALANILLLSMPELAKTSVFLAAAGYTVSLIHGQAIFAGQAGDILSLLPLGGDVHGITTEGLEYPLRGETLHLGPARGISNVLTAPEARVRVQDGLLLAVKFEGRKR